MIYFLHINSQTGYTVLYIMRYVGKDVLILFTVDLVCLNLHHRRSGSK